MALSDRSLGLSDFSSDGGVTVSSDDDDDATTHAHAQRSLEALRSAVRPLAVAASVCWPPGAFEVDEVVDAALASVYFVLNTVADVIGEPLNTETVVLVLGCAAEAGVMLPWGPLRGAMPLRYLIANDSPREGVRIGVLMRIREARRRLAILAASCGDGSGGGAGDGATGAPSAPLSARGDRPSSRPSTPPPGSAGGSAAPAAGGGGRASGGGAASSPSSSSASSSATAGGRGGPLPPSRISWLVPTLPAYVTPAHTMTYADLLADPLLFALRVCPRGVRVHTDRARRPISASAAAVSATAGTAAATPPALLLSSGWRPGEVSDAAFREGTGGFSVE